MKLFQFIFSLGLLVALGYLGYKLVLLFTNNVDNFDPNLLLALSVFGLAFFLFLVIRSTDNDNTIKQQDRERRIPVYEELIALFVEQLSRGYNEDYMTDIEMEIINKKATIWLSQTSMKHYLNWRDKAAKVNSDSSNTEALLDFEQLLRSMRIDVGQKNDSIVKGAFLTMFVKDFDRDKVKDLLLK